MPQYIMKLTDNRTSTDYYLIWSTIVDAPVTYGMSLQELKEFYREKYGTEGMKELDERLKRVEETGISAHPPFHELQSYFEYNRAGKKEATLSKDEIIYHYCINRTP